MQGNRISWDAEMFAYRVAYGCGVRGARLVDAGRECLRITRACFSGETSEIFKRPPLPIVSLGKYLIIFLSKLRSHFLGNPSGFSQVPYQSLSMLG
jgi:hypothetical protein